ncbi:CASP8 and FADD-like apoptosis regulator [Salarias fasciatus]|uniref:CASP8 and FADD-like apoptosis regulator n=1 Tax=Salarias fasciatus TaxID=181472 RepID=A0A672J0E7_SALFA|nr:CASP8 and FADD-like apoptosis regulator [Salarias fasciatus]
MCDSMDVPDERHLQQINQIAEALSSGERRTLSYLCECLDSDSSVARVKETLKCKVRCHQDARLLLTELMLRLGRFDVLTKLYQIDRNDAEGTLRYTQALPGFRVLMANISENLLKEDLDAMKFLLGNTLSREKIENAENFLDVIIEMEKLDLVSPERVDLVEKCLNNIGRIDLAKKVTAYKMSVQTLGPVSSPQQSHSHSQVSQRGGQSQCIVRGNMVSPVGREQSSQSSRESYKFNANPRGVCVIIDCVGNDGGMLAETFKALHFNVTLHQWLSVSDMHAVLIDISRQRENFRADAFVCCIISRGATDHLLGTSVHGRGLSMAAVRRLFTAEACPWLAGKPKLFFIQRYSVLEFVPHARMEYRDEDLETDGCDSPSTSIPVDADVFWSHCWTEEHQLERECHHSIYLKALTEALGKSHRRKASIVDVHTEVNGAIFEHNKRNPAANYHIDLRHTLTKQVFLD